MPPVVEYSVVIIATVSPSDPTLAHSIHPNLHHRYHRLLSHHSATFTASDLFLKPSSYGTTFHLLRLLPRTHKFDAPRAPPERVSLSPPRLIRQRTVSPAHDPWTPSIGIQGRNFTRLLEFRRHRETTGEVDA